jgi:RNA polymerase sigma factor (sigma-70 family)
MQVVRKSYTSLPESGNSYSANGKTEQLVAQYQTTRNERLRAQILDRYERMTIVIARRFLCLGEPLEDLVQEGNLGLLRAIDHFDITRGTRFSTYAARRIASAVEHYVRDRGRLIRQPAWIQERSHQVRRESERLRTLLGRDPLPLEVARSLDLTEDQVVEAARLVRLSDFDSLDEMMDEDGHTTRGDFISTTEGRLNSDRLALKIASQSLTEKERTVIHFLFERDLTQKETAETLGISHSKLRRLLVSALNNLRSQMVA